MLARCILTPSSLARTEFRISPQPLSPIPLSERHPVRWQVSEAHSFCPTPLPLCSSLPSPFNFSLSQSKFSHLELCPWIYKSSLPHISFLNPPFIYICSNYVHPLFSHHPLLDQPPAFPLEPISLYSWRISNKAEASSCSYAATSTLWIGFFPLEIPCFFLFYFYFLAS